MTVYPLKYEVKTRKVTGQGADRFGDTTLEYEDWENKPAFGWEISRNTETTGDSIIRTTDKMKLYAPPETNPGPGGQIQLSNNTTWEVEGNPDDYNNNPFFTPGLLVIHAKKVEG